MPTDANKFGHNHTLYQNAVGNQVFNYAPILIPNLDHTPSNKTLGTHVGKTFGHALWARTLVQWP